MPCCHKRRKAQVIKLVQRRIFESDSHTIIKNLKVNAPSILNDQKLVNTHTKIHSLYSKAIKFNPPNKKFINNVVSIHNRYVEEMIKRKMKHTSPIKNL